MDRKKYDPVRIIDPGEGHLVPLSPTQGFIVVLHGKNPEIECNSHFFYNYRTDRGDKTTTFYFNQKFDLIDLRNSSRIYLGDVAVLTENKVGSLCVFLESATRSSYMTVVNPEMNIIKTDPSVLIEIIIFDNQFCGNWDCTIISGDSGIEYQQYDYRKYSAAYNVDAWSWSKMFCGSAFHEHHYSFKCNAASFGLDRGTYPAGKIIFDTEEVEGVFRVLNLNLKVKDKKKQLGPFPANNNSVLFPKGVKHSGRIRRYTPQLRDSIYRQTITFKKKECSDLHSSKVLYF